MLFVTFIFVKYKNPERSWVWTDSPGDPGILALVIWPRGGQAHGNIDTRVHLKIVIFNCVWLFSSSVGWLFQTSFSYFVKQMFHWLVHQGGRERCRFSTCRRCTLGAGSFSLSLAPSNHIIHSLLLKIIWLSVQYQLSVHVIIDNQNAPHDSYLSFSRYSCVMFSQHCLDKKSFNVILVLYHFNP